jgi:hypothetical protein
MKLNIYCYANTGATLKILNSVLCLRCIADYQAQVPRLLIGWGLRAWLAWLHARNAAFRLRSTGNDGIFS